MSKNKRNIQKELKSNKKVVTKKQKNNNQKTPSINIKKNSSQNVSKNAIKNNINNKSNGKKSNYQKIQKQIAITQKESLSKEKKQKELKKQKQIERLKQQEKSKKSSIIKKIKFVILSNVIKFKNNIVKLFVWIKKILFMIGDFFRDLFLKIKKSETKKNLTKDIREKDKSKSDTVELSLNDELKILKSLTGKVLPITKTKRDKRRRKTIYLKEALLFTIIFTLVDVICFYKLPIFNILSIFDNNILNLILTLVLTLLVLFVVAYFIDYIISELIIKKMTMNKKTNKKKNINKKKQGD